MMRWVLKRTTLAGVYGLVACGALGKTKYKSRNSDYFKTNQKIKLDVKVDYKECWNQSVEFMKEHNPEMVDSWIKKQVKDGYVTVLDPFKGECVQLFKVDENGMAED